MLRNSTTNLTRNPASNVPSTQFRHHILHITHTAQTDAKWFDRGEVLKAIAEHTSTSQDRTSTAEGLALPPPFSIAFQLLKFWATREKSLL
ncbi:hypothetical protein IWQ60_002925 [Tieghemiomyces parasiticus]|uniref:Uncharacterized protein n=1 Tax=Tieghemiomyces parasiticus TaxID=78921 RepID=A0A9W8AGI0_9FUNG|nr:hypothetical protein IWQ60_002925 [Tieghemiomyces parasiticus]